MRYTAELTKKDKGERVSLGVEKFEAATLSEAISKAEKFALPLIKTHRELGFDEAIHLLIVTKDGIGVFRKEFEASNAPRT